ncbi:MAG: recombination protein RecR [Clostridia bacterium]|nr:recombination protein RecR [Clostridia bacterium]
MSEYIYPITRLIECFRRLPGVGSKSAARMAFGVLEMPEEEAEEFCAAIRSVKHDVTRCSVCCNLSDGDKCEICSDPGRDASVICAVEDARAVTALERAHEYTGTYHVLGGVISPMNGITPDRLNIKELISRLKDGTVKEVIVATNPNIEGETTAVYLSKLIRPLGVKVTRLAYGVPVGADLEFADSETLARALEGRREF